jgi:hypothetical protein
VSYIHLYVNFLDESDQRFELVNCGPFPDNEMVLWEGAFGSALDDLSAELGLSAVGTIAVEMSISKEPLASSVWFRYWKLHEVVAYIKYRYHELNPQAPVRCL